MAQRYPHGRYHHDDYEFKYYDTTGTVSFPASGTIVKSINLVPQGIGASDRIGRKIQLSSIKVKVRLSILSNSPNASAMVRCILFMDDQANGVGLSKISDLLSGARDTSGTLQDPSYLSFANPVNSGRFTFLSDRTIALDAKTRNQNTYTGASRFALMKVPRIGIPVEFHPVPSDDTLSIEHLASANIGLVFIPNEPSTVSVSYQSRIRYLDC